MTREGLERLALELLVELKCAAEYIEPDLYPEMRAGVDETIANAERNQKRGGEMNGPEVRDMTRLMLIKRSQLAEQMYHALKALLGCMDGSMHSHYLPQAMREAREAINKAEGK